MPRVRLSTYMIPLSFELGRSLSRVGTGKVDRLRLREEISIV